jgi:hypothetical protein
MLRRVYFLAPLLGTAAHLQAAAQLGRREARRLRQLLLRRLLTSGAQAQLLAQLLQLHQLLHLTAQGDLLLMGEQRHPADIPQVGAQQICGGRKAGGGGRDGDRGHRRGGLRNRLVS